MCADDNLQVVNATTPAQYFHLLRRQIRGGPEGLGMGKPLVVFTPKRMLRHPKAVSTIDELTSGQFREVLWDQGKMDSNRVTRVVFCTGQVYYDLAQAREERKVDHVAILRVEQLYPFAAEEVEDAVASYPEGAEVVWAQEEPRNMGAWRFMQEVMQPILDKSGRRLQYAGRPASASPAAGSLKRHQAEQADLIGAVFAAGSRVEQGSLQLVER